MKAEDAVRKLRDLPSIANVRVLAEDGSILDVVDVEGEAQPDGSYTIWLRGEYRE